MRAAGIRVGTSCDAMFEPRTRRAFIAPLLVAVTTLADVVGMTAASRAAQEAGEVFVKRIPDGYRDWRLISVA